MALSSKLNINPYLIELAKGMLYYELVGIDDAPSYQEMATYLYDRYKDTERFGGSTFKNKKKAQDPVAFSRADRIRHHILSQKTYRFSELMLDHLVSEIKTLHQFENWREFEIKYGADEAAKSISLKYKGVPYTSLGVDERREIVSAAKTKILQLNLYHSRTGKVADHKFLLSNEKFIIRPVHRHEIKQIERLAEAVYPCPINRSDLKQKWYDRNEYIYNIYYGEYGMIANINVIPLMSQVVDALREGRIYEHQIRPEDIYPPDKKNNVTYLYIEGFACISMSAFLALMLTAPEIVSRLANPKRDDLVICAIGGSVEGDLNMKNLNFKCTGNAYDNRERKYYPFLEISWKKLLSTLEKRKAFQSVTIVDGRLTRLDLPDID